MASIIPASRQRKVRSPWGVWWLSVLTFSIYYLVWYVKLNKDIASLSGGKIRVGTFGLWFSQCVPIANLVSLAATSQRLAQVQAMHGLSVTPSTGMTLLSYFWFASNTRYLQRRLNWSLEALQDQGALAARSGASAISPPGHAITPSLEARPESLPEQA